MVIDLVSTSPSPSLDSLDKELDLESEETSSSDENKKKQRKYFPSMWDNVPVVQVKELPEGINDLVVFELNDMPENLKHTLKDGKNGTRTFLPCFKKKFLSL